MAGGGVPCHHQGAEEAALDLGPAGARPGLRCEGGLLLPVSATSRRLSACRPRGRLPGPCSPCHPLPHPQPSRMLPHAPSTAVLTCLLLEPSPSKRRCRRDHTTALLGYLEAADYQEPVHALPPGLQLPGLQLSVRSPPFPPQRPSRNHWLLQDTRPPSVPGLGPWSSQPRPPFPLPAHGSCFHLPANHDFTLSPRGTSSVPLVTVTHSTSH